MQRHRLAGLLALATFTALFWTALLAAVLWLAGYAMELRTIAAVAFSIAGIVLLFGAALFTDRTGAEEVDEERAHAKREDRNDDV